MKIKIGDKIKIFYHIDNIKIEDSMTITFINKKYIYTCGHCFPKNANTEYGSLIYSSGFDEPSEENEIAIIKIKDNMLHHFKNISINNDFSYIKNISTIMINSGNKYKGFIISKIKNKLKQDWNDLLNGYKIYHTITKLNEPYYLVKLVDNKEYIHGLSGSPWIVYQNGINLLGSHIGRTEGKDQNNNKIMIAYVKPLKDDYIL